jgi:hypothetical protein
MPATNDAVYLMMLCHLETWHKMQVKPKHRPKDRKGINKRRCSWKENAKGWESASNQFEFAEQT